MIIKQVRVAQALRGETSNLLEPAKYELSFDKGILHVKLKNNPRKLGSFMVFPANIAWIEYEESTQAETNHESATTDDTKAAKPKAAKK